MSRKAETFKFVGLLALATGLGIASGLVASGLRMLLELLGNWQAARWTGVVGQFAWVWAAVLGATVSVWLVRRFAPEAAGSGVQEVEAALCNGQTMRWKRVIPVKLLGSILSLGGNLSMGREGPTVHVGGALGAMVAQWFRRNKEDRHALIASGAAAGLAAAFNAPLSGVLFVLEEMRPHFHYGWRTMQVVFVGAATADATARLVMGEAPVFALPMYPTASPLALPLFAVLGLTLGALGATFNRAVLWSVGAMQNHGGKLRALAPVAVGLAVGVVAIRNRDAVGGGYAVIVHAIDPGFTVRALVTLCVLRCVLTLGSYASGAPGGLFTPMLALGTLTGLLFSHFTQAAFPGLTVAPGVFAIAGMAAFFAATVRAPVTGVTLAVEMTGDYAQILPLLVACVGAALAAELAGVRPLYALLLERQQKIGETADALSVQ